MKRIAVIGSHGLYANFGGWDQLVRNLAERKINDEIEYLIFNSLETPERITCPQGVNVKRLRLSASGFQGLFYDFWSILLCYWKVDAILFLGVQGMPLIPLLHLFRKVKIVSNVGGIEWERPKFGYFARRYLKFCFRLSFIYSEHVVLDNPHYKTFLPKRNQEKAVVIPYGGEIDTTLEINKEITKKYPFIVGDYFLSISRALADNLIDELCASFMNGGHTLVLISNFSSSTYGKNVYGKYRGFSNIVLIDGLYDKAELDLVRRKCKAYIHTHTLCGTAPSLVEMIIAQRPIISIDNPQNRFTLHDQAFFFLKFAEIQKLIQADASLGSFMPSEEICKLYDWNKIVADYESVLY